MGDKSEATLAGFEPGCPLQHPQQVFYLNELCSRHLHSPRNWWTTSIEMTIFLFEDNVVIPAFVRKYFESRHYRL